MSLTVWTQGCMSRIFPHQDIPTGGPQPTFLHAARGEVEAFQIGVHGAPDGLNDIRAEASDLVCGPGATIAADCINILYPEYVPVHWHSAGNDTDDLEGVAPGFYPDPLLRQPWRGVGRVTFPHTLSIWVRVSVPLDAAPGDYAGSVRVTCGAGSREIAFGVRVAPFALPEASGLLMTNWLLPGPILKYHGVEPLTEQFWDVMALYAKNLAAHRQNVVLTPLFPVASTGGIVEGRTQDQLVDMTATPDGEYAFDFTNLERWIDLFLAHGFRLIEGGHLAGGSTRPSAIAVRDGDVVTRRTFPSTGDEEYRSFLGQYLKALRDFLAARGWLDRFCLHLSDEPHGDQFDAYTDLAMFVKSAAPEIPLIDAMGRSEYAAYVDHPVPLESVYEEFTASDGVIKDDVWFYYCCGPTGAWPNRFIDYPLIRTRIFTWLAFKHGIPGFLHWGLNHWGWHAPNYRAEAYNPYDNTTGGSLQAGDSYVLYPPRLPKESHEPVDSIRWEIVRKGMEDYEYLVLLREAAGVGGDVGARAAGMLDEFEQHIVPSFTEHTRDATYLEVFRRRAGRLIARAQSR
jgi:hypothetical protein